MRILIVDDNGRKVERIVSGLCEVPGIDVSGITQVTDVLSARRELRKTRYDLVILDIALPPRLDSAPEVTAGATLLEELSTRAGYLFPTHLIGLTAYPSALELVQSRFATRLLSILPYSDVDDEWLRRLQARLRLILASRTSASTQREHSSLLCVVCALEDPELTSLLQLPWNWEQYVLSGDHVIYYRGHVDWNERRELVFAAAADEMGIAPATVLATKLIHAFRPRYLAMAGITAGLRGRVELGDVIAADPCWDWGAGKWVAEDGETQFLQAPRQAALLPELRTQLKDLSKKSEVFARIKSSWQASRPASELRLRVGPVATGASVVADTKLAEFIEEQHRKLLGIEMESYGVFVAGENACQPRPKTFVLKGASDFADERKNDQWQHYAAYVSAQTLRYFVENYLAGSSSSGEGSA